MGRRLLKGHLGSELAVDSTWKVNTVGQLAHIEHGSVDGLLV